MKCYYRSEKSILQKMQCNLFHVDDSDIKINLINFVSKSISTLSILNRFFSTNVGTIKE